MEKDKRIAYVINEFDFERVWKAMVAVNWKWRDDGVPSIGQLKSTAKSLLEKTLKDKTGWATGGFQAYLEDDVLGISFNLEDANDEYA